MGRLSYPKHGESHPKECRYIQKVSPLAYGTPEPIHAQERSTFRYPNPGEHVYGERIWPNRD